MGESGEFHFSYAEFEILKCGGGGGQTVEKRK